MKNNNIIPLLSRKNTRVIYDNYSSAINAINSREICKGEVFYIAYNSSLPNYNLPYKRTDIILAYGIEDGEYQILNFCTSNLIYGVKDYPPTMEDLIQEQIFLYHNKTENKWYLVFSPDGINRKIQEIDAKPQTFIDIETGNLWVSYNDKKVRCLNDVCTQEEALAILTNLNFSQRDWNETDPEKISFIKNKPNLSDLGDLTYTIEKEEQTKRTIYKLYWTEYGESDRVLSGSLVLDEGKILKSGVLDVVTQANKNLVPEDWEIGDKFLDLLISGYTNSHIYIYMEPLVDKYTSGDGGIEINNSIVSVKVDTDSGLTSDIAWRLVSENNNGAMSAEDHVKLTNFNPDSYATNSKLESGEIKANVSSGTRDVIAPQSSYIIKEVVSRRNPNEYSNIISFSTLSEQSYVKDEAIIENISINHIGITSTINPNKKGSNIFNIKLVSTGSNLFNPENIISGLKIDNTTGYIVEDADYSLVWCFGIVNKLNSNFNEPVYDNGYVINTENCVVATSDSLDFEYPVIPLNKATTIFGTESYVIPNINPSSEDLPKDQQDILESTNYLLVSLPTTDLNNLCIQFAWDGKNIGTYEEYEENIVDLSMYDLCFFSNGEYSGEYSEFINNDGTIYLKDIKGEIEDIVELIWTQISSTQLTTNDINLNLSVGSQVGLICISDNNQLVPCYYVQDTENTGTTYLESSSIINGTIYYPKPAEIINTEIPAKIKINKNGMEYITVDYIQSSSVCQNYYHFKQLFIPDLLKQLENLRDDVRGKLGKSDIDMTVTNTSENPVANKVIKQYIDDVISARQDMEVKDLSRFDIFGIPNTGMTTANCYVVYETGTYKIPLVYGNAIKNGNPNTQSYVAGQGANMTNFVNYMDSIITSPYIETDTGISASLGLLVWSETENMITGLELIPGENCNYLKFKVNSIPELNSNAVIGIEDSNHNIMWSWHIWVVYDIDELHPIEIKNSITTVGDTGSQVFNIMPVNLGFVKSEPNSVQGTSPYYQWGRKDPMKRAASITGGEDLTLYGERLYGVYGSDNDQDPTKTIGNAIKNPNLFFLEYNTTYYNWHAPVQNTAASTSTISVTYNLWDSIRNTTGNNDNSVKSIYDPCPVGWKVPTRDTFRGFTTIGSNTFFDSEMNVIGSFNYGWIFLKYYGDTTGTFFPANGSRYRTSGGLYSVGDDGYCWSSASNSSLTYACNLGFSSTNVYPLTGSYRANGDPVRPVFE